MSGWWRGGRTEEGVAPPSLLTDLKALVARYDKPEPDPSPPPVEEPEGRSRAQIIDARFSAASKDHWPAVPYRNIGSLVVEEVERMGAGGLYLSTACALIEQESWGKNIFGCDAGSIMCNQAVTEEKVQRLLGHVAGGGVSNGVGLTQLTYPPFIRMAEEAGGAHLPRFQVRVGFDHLNKAIASHGWPEGAAVYNAGPSNWQSVMGTYGASMKRKEAEWSARLEKASDNTREEWRPAIGPLAPPGFRPLAPRAGTYMDRHPTRYEWNEPVEAVVRKLYAHFGKRQIHVNTYHEHPGREIAKAPFFGRDTTSLDVWGAGGRNEPIDPEVGQRVFDFLYLDPDPPHIDWIIWRRRIRSRANGYRAEAFGTDPFSWHDDHPHVTYLGKARILP